MIKSRDLGDLSIHQIFFLTETEAGIKQKKVMKMPNQFF